MLGGETREGGMSIMNFWLWCLVGIGLYLLGAVISLLIYGYDKDYRPYKIIFAAWWLAVAGDIFMWIYEWWDDRRLRRWRGKADEN